MKTKSKTVAGAAVYMGLFLLLSASSNPVTDLEIPEISKQINEFTLAMLKHGTETTNIPANAIFSPQSIYHGLAMSYVASGGETRRELAGAVHFPNDNTKLLKDLAELRLQLRESSRNKRIDVNLANALWLDETYADFRKDYVQTVRAAFDAALRSVKFAQKEQATAEINRWISEKTHGKIIAGVSPEDLLSRSRMGVIDEPGLVSVNAIYFKADWGSRFDKASTRQQPFFVDGSKTATAKMMHQKSLLNYSENDDFKFLEIPYIDGGYSMYVILPKENLSIKSIVERLGSQMITDLKGNSYSHEVDVMLPKFEIKSHLEMKRVLMEMGVKSAFDKDAADFDEMIIKKWDAYRIYVSEIYHDAWIDVHEEGTEAAAATREVHFSIGCSAPMRYMPVEFHADHPFLFMIMHNQSRSILFTGWISNPGL